MNKETLRMQMLAGVITEGQYKTKLEKLNSTENKDSLNENFIGMGAINNPFAERKKEKYEDAFEHFLSSKYTINEEIDEEQVEEEESFEDVSLDEGDGSGGTTVGELLGMLNSINPNAEISLNYDGDEGTEVTALNSVDTEGLGFDEPEIILVGETTEDHMTVGELKSELSKMDPSTYVTLNLDLDSGTVVINNIEVDSEMANDEERPEIILFGS